MTGLRSPQRVTGTPPHPGPGLLLASQLVFNVGFYAVVPFLALVMTHDFGMTATAVGVVLGARVFSQQGLFLVGLPGGVYLPQQVIYEGASEFGQGLEDGAPQ